VILGTIRWDRLNYKKFTTGDYNNNNNNNNGAYAQLDKPTLKCVVSRVK